VPQKSDLRRQMMARLAAQDAEQRAAASAAACRRFAGLPEFAAATNLFVFLSMATEIDTADLIAAARTYGKPILVPRIRPDHTIEAVAWPASAALVTGTFGIRVPSGGAAFPTAEIDLIAVPGLAFDDRGGRLGRGGGYYDRFLAAAPGATAVGLAFEFQVVTTVPCADHDVRVGALVTEVAARDTAG